MSNYLKPFDFYKVGQGLMLHFKSDKYDWLYANGAIKCAATTFDKRKDCKLWAFASSKICRKDIFGFFVSNIVKGNKSIIWNFDESLKNYNEWSGKILALSHNFEQELKVVEKQLEKNKKSVDNLFDVCHNAHSMLLKGIIAGKVSYETVILIDKFCRPFIEQYDMAYKNDPLWKKHTIILKKYGVFFDGEEWIKFDPGRIKSIWTDFCKNVETNLL